MYFCQTSVQICKHFEICKA